MKKEQLLKKFQSQLNNIESEILLLKSEISEKNRVLTANEKARDELKNKIKEIGMDKDLIISEHAIVRYFERVMGINIEQIKKEILTDSVLDLIGKFDGNNGEYPVKEGNFSIRVKNNIVVTII